MAANLVKILSVVLCAWGISADEIYRPCATIIEECVGAELKKYSSCSLELPDASTLDPFSLDHFFFATPYFNVTEDRSNIVIKGVSQAYVQDLYTNTTSNKAVLTIFYPQVSFEGDTNVHYFDKPGQEPFNITTHYKVQFTNMTLTTIFNDAEDLTLKNSLTFPYLPIPPTYDNGDELQVAAKNNPRVATLVAAWDALPNVATIEAFQYRGPALVKLYTNYKLCRYD